MTGWNGKKNIGNKHIAKGYDQWIWANNPPQVIK